MSLIQDVTPLVPVGDIEAASRFLQDCFGFEERFRVEGHAYLASGSGAVRLINAPPDADLNDPAWQIAIYMDVADVDALYAAHQSALEALPEGHLRAPFDRDYGQREFHAIHGPLLVFAGQPIA